MKKSILIALILVSISSSFFVACKKSSTAVAATAVPTVTALTCAAVSISGTATINTAYSGNAIVPYTGGNSVAYTAGSAINSSGVLGLTATLVPGTLSASGNLSYTITGTPTSAGVANIAISFGGQSCTISLNVNAVTVSSCSSLSGVAKLICLCNELKSSLSSTQLASLQLAYSSTNIKTWSNLPASMSPRLGIKLSTLNTAQLETAKAIIQVMSGTVANEGWDEVQQLWLADDYLSVNGGGTAYGSGNYYLAFFGTPANTGQFEIMMTGHHKTVANSYNNGVLIAATPHFAATEPLTWNTNGINYAPLNQEQGAFVTLLAGLNATQLAAAKSSSVFSDLLLTPGKDWQFPTTFTGLACSSLSATQKTLVINAIKTYTSDIDDTNAALILTKYTADLDNTYITYSGTTALNTQNDYIRIDGPSVWIEFSVQRGIVLSGVHYHSIWRDRINDYGTTR